MIENEMFPLEFSDLNLSVFSVSSYDESWLWHKRYEQLNFMGWVWCIENQTNVLIQNKTRSKGPDVEWQSYSFQMAKYATNKLW